MRYIQLWFEAINHVIHCLYARIGHAMRSIVQRSKKHRCAAHAQMWSVLFSAYAGLAIAQVAEEGPGIGAAPWESSLCGVAAWFQGPTMLAVGTIAFGVAGASFVFGEELSGILRRIVNITMGICLAVGGTALLGWIAQQMGATGAACAV